MFFFQREQKVKFCELESNSEISEIHFQEVFGKRISNSSRLSPGSVVKHVLLLC